MGCFLLSFGVVWVLDGEEGEGAGGGELRGTGLMRLWGVRTKPKTNAWAPVAKVRE